MEAKMTRKKGEGVGRLLPSIPPLQSYHWEDEHQEEYSEHGVFTEQYSLELARHWQAT